MEFKKLDPIAKQAVNDLLNVEFGMGVKDFTSPRRIQNIIKNGSKIIKQHKKTGVQVVGVRNTRERKVFITLMIDNNQGDLNTVDCERVWLYKGEF